MTPNDQPTDAHSATQPSDDVGHVAHRLVELMEEFQAAMLVTRDDDGLRSRPMSVAEVGRDNSIVFVTSLTSTKVAEIRKHPAVLVTMQSATRYVSIGGPCEVSRDRTEIDRLWNESWKIWFPDGKQDPEIVLLRVKVETGEFWDLSGTHGIRFLWAAAKAYFQGETVAKVAATHGVL